MKLNLTRRDVMKAGAGGVVGVMLTPAPWKGIDDLAIWTQNWSWMPVPPKGEETTSLTVCSLCPAGCAVRARCVGGQPVSLHPVAADAVSGGALCALGLTGHHLAYHPARLSQPVRAVGRDGARRTVPVGLDAAVAYAARGVAAALSGGGGVAVLDMRPGRGATWAWRRFLAGVPGAAVVAAPGLPGASLATLQAMAGGGPGPIGLDLARARTVVSFGAPLVEGWGAPGRAAHLLWDRPRDVRLTQVDALRSRTAEIADRWLPTRPGTEADLALGLGHVLLAEGLVDARAAARARDLPAYAEIAARFTPEAVASATGVPAELVVATARELAGRRPALALAGEDAAGGGLGGATRTAIWALDLLLGALDGEGVLVGRRELPDPANDGPLAPLRHLDEVDDRSLARLLVDASAGDAAFPWPLVRRTLARGGMVVALSPFIAGTAGHADVVVPTPPFLEGFQELPSGFDAPTATYAVALPLLPAGAGCVDAAGFVRALAGACGIALSGAWRTAEDLAKARVARLHEAGRGGVAAFGDGALRRAADFPTAEDLWKALAAGGRWVDEEGSAAEPAEFSLLGEAAGALAERAARIGVAALGRTSRPLSLVVRAGRDVTASAAVAPVLTKVYRESGLRRGPGTAVVNPETARALGVSAGRTARIETAAGGATVTVATDAGVMPGVVEVEAAPNGTALGDRGGRGRAEILDLCGTDPEEGWRSTPARMVEA